MRITFHCSNDKGLLQAQCHDDFIMITRKHNTIAARETSFVRSPLITLSFLSCPNVCGRLISPSLLVSLSLLSTSVTLVRITFASSLPLTGLIPLLVSFSTTALTSSIQIVTEPACPFCLGLCLRDGESIVTPPGGALNFVQSRRWLQT